MKEKSDMKNILDTLKEYTERTPGTAILFDESNSNVPFVRRSILAGAAAVALGCGLVHRTLNSKK